MKAILIIPKEKAEAVFVLRLLRRLRIPAQKIALESIEDAGMWNLMQEADKTEIVSREEVMKKLRS